MPQTSRRSLPATPRPHNRRKPAAETRSPAERLHVVMASPEILPFGKTGGLADVLGSLPRALEKLGTRVSLIMPAYRSVLNNGFNLEETDIRFSVPLSDRLVEASVLKSKIGEDISVYFIRADQYFDRDYLYGTPEGDYPDNAERFVFFARSVLEVANRLRPQILHCHDWQSAPAIVFLKSQPQSYPELSSVKTVLTVHNVGYQGLFGDDDWHLLNLDQGLFTPRYMEFYGRINFLKGGIIFADAVTTVSPTHVEEIKMPGEGFGLEGVFQQRASDTVGIINGVDYGIWNPEIDPHIAQNYSLGDLAGKKACKADLQRSFGLPEDPEIPLISMVSRLAAQKGFDLVEQALDEILRHNVQFVLLGTGDKPYEEFFRGAAGQRPGKMAVHIGFSEALAHKITAGADMFLMPSRYEPGGLNQIYSLKYGTLPIVRGTGGLKDTVEEFKPESGEGNGFVFESYDAASLLQAVDRALALFQQKEEWATLMKNALLADFSWDSPAAAYLDLYKRVLKS